jgi:hypothetical protein
VGGGIMVVVVVVVVVVEVVVVVVAAVVLVRLLVLELVTTQCLLPYVKRRGLVRDCGCGVCCWWWCVCRRRRGNRGLCLGDAAAVSVSQPSGFDESDGQEHGRGIKRCPRMLWVWRVGWEAGGQQMQMTDE